MNTEIIGKLVETVRERKRNPQDDSYTCKLLEAGENKLVKKLGEENAEFIRAFLKESDESVAGEAADIIYHMVVALEYRGVEFEAVLGVLENRFGKSGIRK
ncbi:MAG: phosphoribosyl-ATP diphosphatase [Geovibrio sp.]|uniref:phosphoribosyl-ATP diphosphatase n=1 Tax=Geovibrio ferrireducens TaxID=46201 RepID=UPI002247F942|nr:phosphoribosyl-ATP diphosphatase [Geovibrio ferrireducens]MCD8568898.1 phosphoribosyl-ATP diphosphatase [Geovibrio sp.]